MEKKPTQSSEEIDLLYFFRPLGIAIKKVWNFGISYTTLLAHNRYLFAGILLLGSIAGYSLRFVIDPSYKTGGVFVSELLPSRYCVTLINSLNELRKPNNVPLLAKQLNINNDAALQIQGITATVAPRDTFVLEKRDSALSSVFYVTLALKDMRYLEDIQKGLVAYLENNEYARKHKEAREANMRIQMAELDIKLKSLDSLQQLVNSSIVPRSQGQGIILGEPINPVAVYQAEISYMRERLTLQERLTTIEHIEILQPFLKLNEYNSPNYNKILNYAFVASFLFGLVVVLMIGRRPVKR
jgi:hypothetical protein